LLTPPPIVQERWTKGHFVVEHTMCWNNRDKNRFNYKSTTYSATKQGANRDSN